jgi:ADP-ribose pyrophosphatase YjhB (NUDIX family)
VNVRRFAGVVAVHEDRVVLVREHRDAWGRPCWSVPSGELQPRESPARGAVRELLEETGLVVPTNDLRLVSTSSTANAGSLALAWNFTAIVGVPHLEIADPDLSLIHISEPTRPY